MDTDGVATILHCNHRTQPANRNNTCSQDVIPAKAMKLSVDDMKACEEIVALDPGRRTILTTWSPSTGAFFVERNKYYELSRARTAKEYHAMKNAAIQEELDGNALHPGK